MRDIAPSVREAIEALASDRTHGAARASWRRWQRVLWGRSGSHTVRSADSASADNGMPMEIV